MLKKVPKNAVLPSICPDLGRDFLCSNEMPSGLCKISYFLQDSRCWLDSNFFLSHFVANVGAQFAENLILPK